MIELSRNKGHSLGAVPNVTEELIPQAKHSTHPPPLPLSTLMGHPSPEGCKAGVGSSILGLPIASQTEPHHARTLAKFLIVQTVILLRDKYKQH